MISWFKWHFIYKHDICDIEVAKNDRVDILKLFIEYGGAKVDFHCLRVLFRYRARKCLLLLAPMFKKKLHKIFVYIVLSDNYNVCLKNVIFLCELANEMDINLSILTALSASLRLFNLDIIKMLRRCGVPIHPMACAAALSYHNLECLRYLYVEEGAPWTLQEKCEDLACIYAEEEIDINRQFGSMASDLILEYFSKEAVCVLKYKRAVRLIECAWMLKKQKEAALVIAQFWLEKYYSPSGTGARRANDHFNTLK
jgi:hypothetical protein